MTQEYLLTETQKQRVNSHGVNAKENRGDEVSPQKDEENLSQWVVKERAGEMLVEQCARQINKRRGSHSERDQKLRKEEKEVGRLVQRNHSQNISH